MNKKLAVLAVVYCAASGVKSLIETVIVAGATEMVKEKISLL